MVDCGKLIYLIHKNESLWNSNHINYHNRGINKKLWRKIGMLLNIKAITAKSRWSGLRDTYRKEYIKILKNRIDSDGKLYLSKWRYYKHMYFLSNTLNLPKIDDDKELNLEDQPEENNPFADLEMSTDYINTECEAEEPSPVITVNEVGGKRFKIEQSEQRLNEIIEQTVPNQDKDGDYFFAMSILPHLRDLPKSRKLSVRMKIQQILMEEEQSSMCIPNFEINNLN